MLNTMGKSLISQTLKMGGFKKENKILTAQNFSVCTNGHLTVLERQHLQ